MTRGYRYWSIIGCRRVNGKPTPYVIEYLGNDQKLMQLVQAAKTGSGPIRLKSYAYGAVRALLKVAEEISLIEIFQRHFPKQVRNGLDVAQTILLASIYRTLRPGSKRAFRSWARTNSLKYLLGFDPGVMTAQKFWDQMDEVTEEQLPLVETEVCRKVLEQVGVPLETLLYDVTNFYTYVATGNERNQLCRRGHNKQRRNNLRQYNLSLLVTRRESTPVWWTVYEGNIPDVASFPKRIAAIQSRLQAYIGELRNITIVVDKGNYSKEIQRQLEQAGLDWICALPLRTLPEVCEIKRSEFYPVTLGDCSVPAYRLERTVWGKKMTLVLTFSEQLRNGQLRGFEQALLKTQGLLKEMNGSRRDPVKVKAQVAALLAREHVGEVLKVTVRAEAGCIKVDWTSDDDRYGYLVREYFGRRLLLSTRSDLTDAEVIQGYDGLGTIENVFRRMKDPLHLSVIPEYHWTDHKIKVHVFTCIIGLILCGLLQKRVRDQGIEMTSGRILDELSNVREAWISVPADGKAKSPVRRQLEEMDEETRRIATAAGI